MEPRLTGIDRKEALRYLGCRPEGDASALEQELARCSQIILDTARPRAVWRVFPWLPQQSLPGTDFTPAGNDIRALLQDCRQVVLFGATLGMEIEALLRTAQLRNMAEAVILDSCASAAIENVCDNLCADLEVELGAFLTERFSPGYGDFPLAQQTDIWRILDMQRRIGVSLHASGLMLPQKTVTALMGLTDKAQQTQFSGCAQCRLFETCSHRKEKNTCGRA